MKYEIYKTRRKKKLLLLYLNAEVNEYMIKNQGEFVWIFDVKKPEKRK